MSEYATYTKFYSQEDAQLLTTLLEQHNIPYLLEHEVNQIDKIYIGETIDAMFALKIPGNRFNDVQALLAEKAKEDMAQPDFKHYLQSYSVEELLEIVKNPASSSGYDIQVATALLSQKNAVPTAIVANDILWTPTKLETIWIILGYLASILSFTTLFILGSAGFFSGLSIVQAKQTLKNGDTVSTYTEGDRRHGRNMMVLSVVCFVIGFVFFYRRYRL